MEVEALLLTTQENLINGDYKSAETALNHVYFKHSDSVKESPLLVRALLLQAHLLAQAKPLIHAEKCHLDLDFKANATNSSQEEIKADLSRMSNGLSYIKKALDLTRQHHFKLVRNIAISLLTIVKHRFMDAPKMFIETLRDIAKEFGQPEDDDVELLMLLLFLLARLVIADEFKDNPLKKSTEEVKELVLKASGLAQANERTRFVYMNLLRQVVRATPKTIDLIEPSWATVSFLKPYVLLERLKAGQKVGLEMFVDAERELNGVHPIWSGRSIYVDPFTLRIDLAKEALAQGLFPISEKLLTLNDEVDLTPRSSGIIKLLYAELAIKSLSPSASRAFMHQTTMSAVQNVCRIVNEARQHQIQDVVADGCIKLWNFILPVLEDSNRHNLVGFLRDICTALDSLAEPMPELSFLLHHELSKCYEHSNLLSLAKTHSQISQKFSAQVEYTEDWSAVTNRIEAKLKSLSTNLNPATQALVMIDRSHAGSFHEAMHCFEASMRALVPSYEQKRRGDFVTLSSIPTSHSSKKPDLPVQGDHQTAKVVFAELMRATVKRARDSVDIIEKSEDRQELIYRVWGLAFEAAWYYLELSPEVSNRPNFLKRVAAEAHFIMGESQSRVDVSAIPLADAIKAIETATSHLVSSMEIGKELDDKRIVYNAVSQSWALFVKADSLRSKDYALVELWMDILQNMYDTLVELKMNNSTMFVYFCVGYISVLLEAFAVTSDPTKAKKGQKETTQHLKTAEEACRLGFLCKEANYHATFLLVQAWGRLQHNRAPGSGQPADVDDALLKLFCLLEQPPQGKITKDQEVTNLENAVMVLIKIKNIPNVFKAETLARLSLQALGMNQYVLAYGCIRKAMECVSNLLKSIDSKGDSFTEQWLASIMFSAARVHSAFLDQEKTPLAYAKMVSETLGYLNSSFSKCFLYPEETEQLFTSGFRLLWNVCASLMTRKRARLIAPHLLQILKSASVHYVKSPKFKDILDKWDSENREALRNLFLALIDFLVDEQNHQAALRVCEWAFKMMPIHLQGQIWHRKTFILNAVGKGSSIVPLKDPSVEVQAQMWNQLARSLTSSSKKKEAFQMASKLLSSKKANMADIALLRGLHVEHAEWAVSRAGLANEIDSLLPRAAEPILEVTLEDYLLSFREDLVYLSVAKTIVEQRDLALNAFKRTEFTIQTLMRCCRPSDSDELNQPTKSSAKGKKSKESAQVETIEYPSPEKWASYTWPAAVRSVFGASSNPDFINKSSIKAPLDYLSYLFRLVQHLSRLRLVAECFPILHLMELVADECCKDQTDLQITILLYHAVILKLKGQDKKVREKYLAAMNKKAAHRESQQLELTSYKARRDPFLYPLGDLQRIWLVKAEAHFFFGDVMECRNVLIQCIRLSTFRSDVEALERAYSFLAMIYGLMSEPDSAYTFAQRSLRSQPEDPATHIRATFALFSSKLAMISGSGSQKDRRDLGVEALAHFENMRMSIQSSECSENEIFAHALCLFEAQLSLLFWDEETFGGSTRVRRELVLKEIQKACRAMEDNAREVYWILKYVRKVISLGFNLSYRQEIKVLLEDIEYEINKEGSQPFGQSFYTELLLNIARVDLYNTLDPDFNVPVAKMGVIEEYVAELDRELQVTEKSDHHTMIDGDALTKVKKHSIPSHLKQLADFCFGMDSFLQVQNVRASPSQEETRKDTQAGIIKQLNEALESQLTALEYRDSKVTAEALFTMTRHDIQASFKYLQVLQSCDTSAYLYKVWKELTTSRHPNLIQFPTCGNTIWDLEADGLMDKSTQFVSSHDNLLRFCRIQTSIVHEWPKAFKVLILQHSQDRKKLYGGLLARRKESWIKTDRKKTPSDEYYTDYEVVSVEVNPEIVKAIQIKYNGAMENGLLTEMTEAMNELVDYVKPLLIQFKREEEPSEPGSTEKPEKPEKDSRPKSMPKEAEAVPEDDVHCTLCLDTLLEGLPLEVIISKQLTRIQSVSRDFNLNSLVTRLRQRDALSKPVATEAPKKREKGAPAEADKDKSAINAFSYCVTSPLGVYRDQVQDELSTKNYSKSTGVSAIKLSRDEIVDTFLKQPMFFFLGETLSGYASCQDLEAKYAGSTGIILDYTAARRPKGVEINEDAKRFAAYFTLFGIQTIAVPYTKLNDKQSLLIFKSLLNESSPANLAKSCLGMVKSIGKNVPVPIISIYGLNATFTFQ